jgi:capsular polysaccharide biosynthesis protein
MEPNRADMEIRRYLSIIRRRLVLVVAIMVAALAAGWLITPRDDTYTATATLYVGSRSIDPTSDQVSGDRVAGLDRLITTFTELVHTRPVAEAAAAEPGVTQSADEIMGATSAGQVPSANLINVSVTLADPAESQLVANAVSAAFVDQIRSFEPRDTAIETEQVVSVYELAQLPSQPEPSGLLRNLALAGVLGIIVTGIVLALLEYLDITLRSPEDAERQLGLPVLGVVPALGGQLPVARVTRIGGPAPASPPGRRGAPAG